MTPVKATQPFERLENVAERAELLQPFLGVRNWIAVHATEGEVWEDVPLDEEALTYIKAVRHAALEAPVSTSEQVQQQLTDLVNSGTVRLSCRRLPRGFTVSWRPARRIGRLG